jgi:adenylate cyclase
MTTSEQDDGDNEAYWREFLTRGDPRELRKRRIFKRIPTSPRCRLCAAPFAGPGATLMRAFGRRQATQNPTMCATCFTFVSAQHGGAEIEITMLFADIRGSTTLAEGMSGGEFRRLLDRFYAVATEVVFDNDGTVDKFVGDELVAAFPPFLGADHARRAVDAATALLRRTGHGDPDGPWVAVGAGVHTGRVWFGTIGEGNHVEITVVGDVVNTTARLASAAGAGEVLVSNEAARAAGLDDATLEHRSLELKGKEASTGVVSVRIGPVQA